MFDDRQHAALLGTQREVTGVGDDCQFGIGDAPERRDGMLETDEVVVSEGIRIRDVRDALLQKRGLCPYWVLTRGWKQKEPKNTAFADLHAQLTAEGYEAASLTIKMVLCDVAVPSEEKWANVAMATD